MSDGSDAIKNYYAANLDRQRLEAEERHRADQIGLERYRIRTVSVAVAITLALIPAVSAIGVALVQYVGNQNALRLEGRKEDREFLSTYADQLVGSDLRRRLDFAETAIALAPEGSVAQTLWIQFRDRTRVEQETLVKRNGEILAEASTAELTPESYAALERELEENDARLTGGSDVSLPPRTLEDAFNRPAFDDFVKGLGLRYISSTEMLTLGASNSTEGAAAQGLNSYPPRSVWPNMGEIARVLDEFRHRHGAPIRIVSFYRSPRYNAALRSAATTSRHLTGSAVDFASTKGTPFEWARIMREIRAEGLFTGGIGINSTFLHIDLREGNVDWGLGTASQAQTD
ncbi:DUF882 domain-containing protein [Rhodobacteraceae bacterium CCMM004]|nr:DUF882 domain-containing protein [Rhodobacteraceae bacterium CCMM004]